MIRFDSKFNYITQNSRILYKNQEYQTKSFNKNNENLTKTY